MNVIAFRAADRRPAHGGYPDPPAPGQYEPCPFCEGEFPIMLTRDHAGHVVICTSCIHNPAPGKDLCPTHRDEWLARRSAAAC
jgi:hypothetical protein